MLLAPAERADVIVDFAEVSASTDVVLQNVGPDEPFGSDSEPADPDRPTGQVMRFHVVPATSPDPSTPPHQLQLPAIAPLGPATATRQVSLNEQDSRTVPVVTRPDGSIVFDCGGEPFGPAEADLGTLNPDGSGNPLGWDEPITETPEVGAVEVWEMYNFTADAHPIHIHEVTFEIVNRQRIGESSARPPELRGGEEGHRDRLSG